MTRELKATVSNSCPVAGWIRGEYNGVEMKAATRFWVISGLVVSTAVLLWAPGAPGQDNSIHDGKPVRVDSIVEDATGKPVANAEVVLESKDKSFQKRGVTNTEGRCSFRVIDAGVYTFRAEKKGVGKSERDFHVVISARAGFPGEKHVDSITVVMNLVDLVRAPVDGKNMEFDDRPSFTVAGVTDWSNTGTHGSDVRVKTSETLAKETLALKDDKVSTHAGESETNLNAAREDVRKKLAAHETADLRRAMGDLDEKLGDPLEAVREFERAVQLEPSDENYFAWGTELILHKADQPATEVFAKGANAYPESTRMLEGMAVALYGAGSYDEAAKKMCEAADLKAGDAAAYLFLGKMDKAAPGPLPCAEERLAQFAKLQPENPLANYYYGVALRKRAGASENADALRRAEGLLQKAVEIDPKFSDGYLQLGIVRSALGEIAPAGRDYEKAIELNPQNAEAHYRLGAVYRMTGDKAKAEQEYETYKQLEKAEAEAAENQRKELRQFVITLRDAPAAPH